MNEEQIGDIWMLFREHVDKKAIEALAERYVDLLADLGVADKTIKDAIGFDEQLDTAIEYYLDQDSIEEEEDEDNWDYNEDED
jgi:hypothetical protein